MESENPKHDQSDNNRIGAYILIGIGVLFLLNSVLRINLWQFWPLLLVGLGIYMLYGRNQTSTAKNGVFTAPLDDTQSAQVNLHLSAGQAAVSAISDASTLIDAELTYVGDMDFQVEGEAEKRVTLKQTSDSYVMWLNPANWLHGMEGGYPWRIRLSPTVPMALNIHGGAGEAELDLHQLQVSEFRYESGVGRTDINLPAQAPDGHLNAHINGGVGEVRLNVPAGVDTHLDVNGGVGQIIIDTPPNAALRIRANSGLGSVNVPARLIRTQGSASDFEIGKSGTWTSPDFEQAATHIDIEYDGGVGSLTLR